MPSGAEEGEFNPDATLAPFRKIYNGALCDCDAQDVPPHCNTSSAH